MAKEYICGNCKNNVTDSDKFCTTCGKGLEPLDDAAKSKKVRRTTEDSGHWHGVDEGLTKTTTQTNTTEDDPNHVHKIIKGKVQPAGSDKHVHTLTK